MSAQHTPESLIPAIRQYKHNDGTNGFVIAFDEKLTIEAVLKLEQQRDELKTAWANAAVDLKLTEMRRDELLAEMQKAHDCLSADLIYNAMTILSDAIAKAQEVV
jgi:hypothetical protein